MTVLISIGSFPLLQMTDTELNADDARRLHLMEEMLRDRGYSRNQHGFWVAPGSRMTAAKVESSETSNEHEEPRTRLEPGALLCIGGLFFQATPLARYRMLSGQHLTSDACPATDDPPPQRAVTTLNDRANPKGSNFPHHTHRYRSGSDASGGTTALALKG